jgi:hypothetical protein
MIFLTSDNVKAKHFPFQRRSDTLPNKHFLFVNANQYDICLFTRDFVIISWFFVMGNAKAGPPFHWVDNIPIIAWAAAYIVSVPLRIIADLKNDARLKLVGWSLFLIATLGKPATFWLAIK